MVRKGMEGRASQLQANGTSEGQLLFSFTRDHYWNTASEQGRVSSTPILYPRAPNASRRLWKSLSQVSQARGMCSNMTRRPPGVYVGDPLWMEVSA